MAPLLPPLTSQVENHSVDVLHRLKLKEEFMPTSTKGWPVLHTLLHVILSIHAVVIQIFLLANNSYFIGM